MPQGVKGPYPPVILGIRLQIGKQGEFRIGDPGNILIYRQIGESAVPCHLQLVMVKDRAAWQAGGAPVQARCQIHQQCI